MQISRELKQYHGVKNLEDVRVIRDRHTSMRAFYLDMDTGIANSLLRGLSSIWIPALCYLTGFAVVRGAQLSDDLPLRQ